MREQAPESGSPGPLAGCLAIALLAVSAVVMWWKRRPRGKISVPPAPTAPRAAWGVLAIIAVVGIVYPLVGASMIIALAAEFFWRFIEERRIRAE